MDQVLVHLGATINRVAFLLGQAQIEQGDLLHNLVIDERAKFWN